MTLHDSVEFFITWLIAILVMAGFTTTLTNAPAERRFLWKVNISIYTGVFALLYGVMWYMALGVK